MKQPTNLLLQQDWLDLLDHKEKEISLLKQEIERLGKLVEHQKAIAQKNYDKYESTLTEINRQKEELEKAMLRLRESNEEMEMQRNYLEATVAELEQTMKQLQETNEEMEMQRNYLEATIRELDKANSNMAASINYARRIQKALLPSFTHLQQYIPESFVFLKPKDVVSGDFYWYSIQGHQIIVAAVDCTGHGVPGALMSIIGHSLLDKIVNVLKIFAPERILYALNLSLHNMLNQDETNNKDGMDIALCNIDLKNRTLEYAGAHNPLVLFQDGQMQVIKADRTSIGGLSNYQTYKFTKHVVSLQKPTAIYMFSDGFADQFGGSTIKSETKRLGSTRFYQILASLQEHPLAKQEELLNHALKQWKGAYPQIDDILVMGLKI